MVNISTYVSSVGIPTCAFLFNIVLRYGKKTVQSTAADLLLLLLVFDATVIIGADKFKPLIAHDELKIHIVAIHTLLLFVGFIVWIFSVTIVEKKILSSYNFTTRGYGREFPLFSWLFAWLIGGILIFVHVLTFIYS